GGRRGGEEKRHRAVGGGGRRRERDDRQPDGGGERAARLHFTDTDDRALATLRALSLTVSASFSFAPALSLRPAAVGLSVSLTVPAEAIVALPVATVVAPDLTVADAEPGSDDVNESFARPLVRSDSLSD